MTTMKCKTALLAATLCLSAAGVKEPRTDAFGDPLPPGALLRLGTVRWRACASFLAFTPDGKTLVTAELYPKPAAHFWDVVTGKEIGNCRGSEVLTGMALSPDGKTLAVGGFDILFASVPDGKELRRIQAESGSFSSLCFSPNGKWLAAINWDHHFRVWDVENGKEILSEEKEGEGKTASLGFSPDGKKLCVTHSDGYMETLEVATGKVSSEREPLKPDAARDKPLPSFLKDGSKPAAFSPDGKRMATFEQYDMPPTLGLWDAATGKILRKLTGPGAAFWSAAPVFSPDGKRLAGSGPCAGLLHVWDVETGKDLAQVSEHQAVVCSAVFSPDGRTVLTGCADNIIRVWDADKGTVVRRIEVTPVLRDVSEYQIAFSKDRKVAAVTGGVPTNASLWNVRTGKLQAVLDDGRYGTWVAGFAPDGKTLAARCNTSGNNIWGIQIWDSATGKKVSKNMIDAEGQRTFAFSPDGKTLVVDEDGDLVFWDVARGKEVRKWSLANGRTERLRFAPDGSMIAGVGEAGVDLWDTVTGKVLPALRTPEMNFPGDLLDCLAFSVDGKTVAASGRGGVIYVWDVGTAKMRDVLKGHRDWVTSLDFSPDGARLISGSRDATALIWDLTGIADEKEARPLTADRLASLWRELAGQDAGKAWRAGWRLAADPASSVPFLQKHMRPAEVDASRIAKLIAALDGDTFEGREEASRELAKLGDLAESAVRKALAAKPSLEARRRLDELLDKLNVPVTAPEQMRSLRGVEVLEHIGSPEARRLLDELAKGAEGARLTREAKAALERLSTRKEMMP